MGISKLHVEYRVISMSSSSFECGTSHRRLCNLTGLACVSSKYPEVTQVPKIFLLMKVLEVPANKCFL